MSSHPSDPMVADLIRHARVGAAANPYPTRTRSLGHSSDVTRCFTSPLTTAYGPAIRVSCTARTSMARARSCTPRSTRTLAGLSIRAASRRSAIRVTEHAGVKRRR